HAAVAEDAVLPVERDVALADVVRDQRRDARAEIDVGAVLQQLRGSFRHLVARPAGLAVVLARLVRRAAWSEAALIWLDGLLHHATDENRGQPHTLGIDLADLHDLVDLDNGVLGGFGEGRVEVARAAAHLDVAEAITAIG